MKNWLPGFRTGVLWKKVVGVIGYLLIGVFFLIILGQVISPDANNDERINAVMVLWVFMIGFLWILILVTNLLNLRSKARLGKIPGGVIVTVICMLLAFLSGGIMLSMTSPEFQADRDKQIAEDAAKRQMEKIESEKQEEEKTKAQAKAQEEKKAAEEKINAEKIAAEEQSEIESEIALRAQTVARLVESPRAQYAVQSIVDIRGVSLQEAKKIYIEERSRLVPGSEADTLYDVGQYTYEELMRDAEGAKADWPVQISGTASLVRSKTTGLSFLLTEGENYYSVYTTSGADIYEGSIVTVYGTLEGYNTLTNAMGGQQEVPCIKMLTCDVL